MRRTSEGVWVGFVLLVALIHVACGPSGQSKQELALQEEFVALQEMQTELNGKRQELADLRLEQVAAVVEGVEAETEAGEEEAVEEEVDLASEIIALEEEIAALTDEYGGRLVGALNANPMIEGEEPTEMQHTLIAMKSDEDIALARDWIEKGGDYKRAIEIYNTALLIDPDNEKVLAALAEADSARYMNAELFEQAKKGMTQEQIKAILGQVNLHNIREYPDRGVVAWFYPTTEAGGAAAVWFRESKKTGELEAYLIKFEGVRGQGEEPEEEG
ncbi:MAG: tetratricopeptide repeat protein [Thermoanaerobaculia bacterium]